MSYSPTLSVITASLEVIGVIWVLNRRGRKRILRPAAAILLLLAAYQVVEVLVCQTNQSQLFSKLAFGVVTWLPPLGILLIARLYPDSSLKILLFARILFGVGLLAALWIIIGDRFVTDSVCDVVFARYTTPQPGYAIYNAYYWLGLMSMGVLSARGATKTAEPRNRRQLYLLMSGTLAFTVPSLVTVIFISNPKGVLASLMCHFALLLAVALVFLAREESKG